MSPQPLFRFQLYIAGDTLNSARAIANLSQICETHLSDRHEIEIRVAHYPPYCSMLVRLAPLPVTRILGTLSDPQVVLHSLGLVVAAA